MIKINSTGKYGGVVREFKPKKYKGNNTTKREFIEKDTNKNRYTFTVKGKGAFTFSAKNIEDARRIAKEMGANTGSGRKQDRR